MKLYFVRHGESEANVLRLISNRGYRYGLTGKGRLQAQELAKRLQDVRPTRIYTSPLMRAVQTAEILSGALQAPIKITNALREFDCGVIEEKSDEESWSILHQIWEDWTLRGQWERRIDGGESLCDMRDRFVPFIRRVLDGDQSKGDSIFFIAHGGLYKCTLPLILSNISFAIANEQPFPNTGYVLAEARPQGLVCLEWCGKAVP